MLNEEHRQISVRLIKYEFGSVCVQRVMFCLGALVHCNTVVDSKVTAIVQNFNAINWFARVIGPHVAFNCSLCGPIFAVYGWGQCKH
jgi:hypothetical protein